jgi:predicted RNase H-like HicB family nuclease
MKYHLLCEVGPDGSTQVFVRELPGCYSRAPTFDGAVTKTPLKIREFLEWLHKHGEPITEDAYGVETEVAEIVRGNWPVNLGDSQALFEADLISLDREEVNRCIRFMKYAREDLISLYSGQPKDSLEWKPDAATPRNIKRIAEHVAECSLFYMERIKPRRFEEWPLTFLEVADELSIMRLLNLSDEEMNCQVSYHQPGEWTGTHQPEGWTARKVLRRFVWHERLHTTTVRKLARQFSERADK